VTLEVRPVTAERWNDLERLFGPSGAYSGCWCMYLRIKASEWEANGNAGNRSAMKAIVEEGRVPGLLAYRDGEPAGWVSVAPRTEYGRVERSPVTRSVDDRPAWSIVCFFVHRDERGSGLGRALLDAAVEHAAAEGAEVIEGYPVATGGERISAADAWHGTEAMFEAAGFQPVIRRRERRPVMRRYT
jgi:GNAT superfamily N-acetyltransferase